MFSWINDRRSHQRTAEHLYGAVVAQARQPSFFTHLGVPDTLEGRYEMIVLNLFLVLDRLRGEDEPAQSISRRLTERFVTDMDDCMRELGVGDLKVPKKVKRAAAGLYDRIQDYHNAMAGNDEEALAKAIQSNVFTPEIAEPITSDATALADYIRRSHAAMAHQSLRDASTGTPRFSDIVLLQTNRANP